MPVLGDRNIISYTHHRSTGWHNRSSTSWGEPSTAYRITVTPKRSDSIIIIKYNLEASTATHHALNNHRIKNVTDNTVPNPPSQPGSQNRAESHCTTRGQHNADNVRLIYMTATLPSWGTSSKVFTLESQSWNSDIIRHNHSAGNSDSNVHWTTHLWAEAWELEDV